MCYTMELFFEVFIKRVSFLNFYYVQLSEKQKVIKEFLDHSSIWAILLNTNINLGILVKTIWES